MVSMAKQPGKNMRIAIVENTRVTHHGQIGVALHEAAARVDVFKAFRGDVLPTAQDGYDALVVFGGEQSAVDDADHPYLPGVGALMRQMTDQGRAVLGICLGHRFWPVRTGRSISLALHLNLAGAMWR